MQALCRVPAELGSPALSGGFVFCPVCTVAELQAPQMAQAAMDEHCTAFPSTLGFSKACRHKERLHWYSLGDRLSSKVCLCSSRVQFRAALKQSKWRVRGVFCYRVCLNFTESSGFFRLSSILEARFNQ